jgi:tRNA threonylcarbamoyladenosine biosynthesis protein TsaB
MALILNIETATPVCSVVLAENQKVLSIRESAEDKSHARNLTVFIKEILTEQHLNIRDLSAVAIGKGPGSFTGLRIGVATAKGLAYGANIPLLAMSTLEIMVNHAFFTIDKEKISVPRTENTVFCPMIDARRMEVYMALFDNTGNRKQNESAVVVDSQTFSAMLTTYNIVYFGSGAFKCRELLQHKNAWLLEGIYPSAVAMVQNSFTQFQQKKFEDIAYFEPFYLKDFITTTARKNLLQKPTK